MLNGETGFGLQQTLHLPQQQQLSKITVHNANSGNRDEQEGASDLKRLELGGSTMPLSNKARGRGRPPMAKKSQEVGVKLTMKEGKGGSMFLAEPRARARPLKVKTSQELRMLSLSLFIQG